MTTQPLFCRQSGFGPLASMVERLESGATLNRIIREEGVVLARHDPTAPLSFVGMSGVFERAARATGDRLFGLRVGLGMRPEDYGPFVDYAFAVPVLEQCLRRTCDLSQLQTNAVVLGMTMEGEEVVWALNYRASRTVSRHQHALHILPAMVRGLRQFLGATFMAQQGEGLRLEVALSDPRLVQQVEEATQLTVWGDMDRYAVVFPKAWLTARPAQLRPATLTFCEVYNRYFPRLPRTMGQAVALVVEPVLANGAVHIEEVARQLGFSRRKLQSDLNAEGVVFRDLLRQLRARRAMQLMRETSDTLSQIALAVGYSDQAHFHRAFAAVTGLAPGEWRLRALSARSY